VTKLTVIDFSAQPYDGEDILHSPLGGTQSAVLETCLALSNDLDVTLHNATDRERRIGRLAIKPNRAVSAGELVAADWVVFVSGVPSGLLERIPHRAGRPRLALWAHHDVVQPAVQHLTEPAVLRQLAKYLFASEWQRDRYCATFFIDRAATAVVGNPYCQRALERIERRDKSFDQPHLIYTSTPDRGLSVLVDAFPAFVARHPGAKLTVLSGMELYGSADNEPYRRLFEKVEETPGVRLMKPTGKLRLYECLRDANVFAYPSTIDETFCIAALEARVLENVLLLGKRGALPENFADARFVALSGDPATYAPAWAQFMSDAWAQVSASPPRAELAAAAAAYRERFAPAAVARRVRGALFC